MDLFAVEEFEDSPEQTENKETPKEDEWQDLVDNLQKEVQAKPKPKKVFIFWDFEVCMAHFFVSS